ncbi:MAG: TRAP transporter fused permease subunit [Pseudomonadota bacterium]
MIGTTPRGGWLTLAFAALVVGYHLWLVTQGLVANLVSRPIHLALALGWIFFLAGPGAVIGGGASAEAPAPHRPLARPIGWLIGAAGILACAYIVGNLDTLDNQYGSLRGTGQFVMATVLLLAVLEAARRAIGPALPIVSLLALAYGLFGSALPGTLGHPGLPTASFLGNLTIAEGGVFGPLAGVSVDVVAVFVILGAVVGAGDGGRAFMSLAVRLAGRLRAGAAKVSILASALFGSISGSASANVASTGAITLPTMTRLGYPRPFAAAVEAVASSGGQIMPPLMGAGAFIMVELLGLTYPDIVRAAALPAILFFLAAWIGTDLFAKRYGLKAMAREDIPAWGAVARLAPFFLLPFGALLFVLFGQGRTPQYAAAIAITIAAVLLLVNDRWQLDLPEAWGRARKALLTAAGQIAGIAAIILCAGIVIGVLNQTGLGVKVTSLILSMSGGQLWAALLLTALACLILGMEVPTTAAYIICISVAGPALQSLGLEPLTAHMFVFWYALLSTITPPVCGAVFIAAGMAQTPWLGAAGHAMRLGAGLYVIPLAIVAAPSLLGTSGLVPALLAFAKVAAGLFALSYGLIGRGRLRRVSAAALGLAAILIPLP